MEGCWHDCNLAARVRTNLPVSTSIEEGFAPIWCGKLPSRTRIAVRTRREPTGRHDRPSARLRVRRAGLGGRGPTALQARNSQLEPAGLMHDHVLARTQQRLPQKRTPSRDTSADNEQRLIRADYVTTKGTDHSTGHPSDYRGWEAEMSSVFGPLPRAFSRTRSAVPWIRCRRSFRGSEIPATNVGPAPMVRRPIRLSAVTCAPSAAQRWRSEIGRATRARRRMPARSA